MHNVIFFFLLFFLFACAEKQPNSDQKFEKVEVELPVNDEMTHYEITQTTLTPGSQKALLVGSWQDADDDELVITILEGKYMTFVNGEKNWDNPWSLCDYVNYAPENENENGKFLLVHLADKSSVFYAQEIISLNDYQMDVKIVKSSAGSGMTQTFIRL